MRGLPAICAILGIWANWAVAQTSQPSRPTILSYGSADQYWVATVEKDQTSKARFKTLVRSQALPAGDWRDLGVIYGHATALAQTQGDLAVLLDDGAWKRLGTGGLSTGPALPGTGGVLAWGSVGQTLYAVRAVEGGLESLATQPSATTQAAASTQASAGPGITTRPTTTTRPARLTMLKLDRGQWVGVADLPTDMGGLMAVAGFGNKPVLATPGLNGTVHTFVLNDAKWEPMGDARVGGRAGGAFGLIAAGRVLALWADQEGQIELYLKREGEAWAAAEGFKMAGGPNAKRTLAAAGEEFRMALLEDGKLREQRYDLSGKPRGTLTEMPTPQTFQPDPLLRALEVIVLLAIIVVVMVTFYRRRAAAGEKEE
jgi:hypothetical protein